MLPIFKNRFEKQCPMLSISSHRAWTTTITGCKAVSLPCDSWASCPSVSPVSRPGLTLVLRLMLLVLLPSDTENTPLSGLAWRALWLTGLSGRALAMTMVCLALGWGLVLHKVHGDQVEKLGRTRLHCSRRRAQLSCFILNSGCSLTCTGTQDAHRWSRVCTPMCLF